MSAVLRVFFMVVAVMVCCVRSWADALDWENEHVLQINREAARASFVPFSDVKQALSGDAARSPWVLSLDGEWRFHWALLPENWNGRRVFIHFGGVQSAFYVWVNGERVGYSQDSMTAAEFEITKFARPGHNQLAVEVYRWSDGSYLEDQDMWRLSGIYRSV